MNVKDSPKQQHNHIEIKYFLPAQVVLHLQHPADTSKQGLALSLGKYLRDPSNQQPWTDALEPPDPDRIVTFPLKGEAESAFSIVPTSMRNTEASADAVADLLVDINDQFKGSGSDDRTPIKINGDITLDSVAPNWLVGGGSHQIGSSGPGAWPTALTRNNDNHPEIEFKFKDVSSTKLPEAASGEGVHVAILDTTPCLKDLIDAYNRWHHHEDDTSDHPLIDALLEPKRLRIYPAGFEEIRAVSDFSAAGHRYPMADHGLFAAGIIHTIAPQATLHLYEVLNLYGIGSLESIARGLLQVSDLLDGLRSSGSQQPLVVNCSLTLGVSVDGNADRDLPDQLSDRDLLDDMRISFRQIIGMLDQDDVIVVAAAGNDAHEADDGSGVIERPPARFPAAFENVIGVGALPKDSPRARNGRYITASYSNLADEPPENGYVTFGGEEGDGNGVLGVYIDEIPKNRGPFDNRDRRVQREHIQYEGNDTGWAWWAGTSFAAPVISGLLAAWWGEHPGQTPQDGRRFLDGSLSGETDQGEKVIVAEQS